MLVTGAPTQRHAEAVRFGLRAEFPVFAEQIDRRDRGGAAWQLLIGWNDREELAKSTALTLDSEGDLALEIRWADGSVQTLPCWEIESVAVREPQLPECAEFVGQGQRCSSCRIRKAMHA